MTVQLAETTGPSGRSSHYLIPLVVMLMVAAVIAVIVTVPGHFLNSHRQAAVPHRVVHPAHPYWFVHPGDTLLAISLKTGLSVNQLEAFNPNVNPDNLLPGERLNLWRHPPAPPPPPPKPMFWTVQPGQSFGSIAAKTGINIDTLIQLNPQLKSTSLQPGQTIRLRR